MTTRAGNAVGLAVRLETNHPLACESPDHISPWGTARDNSRNEAFNLRLSALFRRPVKVLDIGCSGGGFVKDMLDLENFAIGLEGSDYSLRQQRAEWPVIPGNLFTCDCSKPFTAHEVQAGIQKGIMHFQLITAWEVLEHISETSLPVFFDNVKRHLCPQHGIFVASIFHVVARLEGNRTLELRLAREMVRRRVSRAVTKLWK